MTFGYYAGIDIGSNAARLVIKNVFKNEKDEIESSVVQEVRIPLRLGQDVFSLGYISDKKKDQLIKTIDCFKVLMDIYNVVCYKAYATSACREASNNKQVIDEVYEKTNVKIDIISGETEAETVSTISKELNIGNENFVYVDVGGGSTEVSLVIKNKIIESTSFSLGTLRILNNKDKSETWKVVEYTCYKYCEEYGSLNIVGTGGNINRYYKMSPNKTKKGNKILYIEDLEKEYEDLLNLSTDQRIFQYGLKPDRADVIIPAGKIFLTIAKTLKSKYIIVPMIGLGDGIVDQLIQENISKQ